MSRATGMRMGSMGWGRGGQTGDWGMTLWERVTMKLDIDMILPIIHPNNKWKIG